MNATPRRLRSISTSLFAAVTAVALSACMGVSSDSEEQVELASAVVEGELAGLTIDGNALACAIDLAELQLEGDTPSFDVPPPGPCPPPVITTIDAPNPSSDAMLAQLAAPPMVGDEPIEPIDPLEQAPESESRPPKLGTVPQGPISLDRPQLRPLTADPASSELRGLELTAPPMAGDEPIGQIDPLEHVPETTRPGKLGTVPQGPISLDRPQLRPLTADPVPSKPLGLEAPADATSDAARMACVNSCVQAYAVCVAHPDHELLTCADQLSACSEEC